MHQNILGILLNIKIKVNFQQQYSKILVSKKINLLDYLVICILEREIIDWLRSLGFEDFVSKINFNRQILNEFTDG